MYGVLERSEKDGPAVARRLRALRWGLVPSWAKDQKNGSRLINARVETLADKPSFRSAFAKRRAILPSSGYYEWQPIDVDGKVRKQPYFIHPTEGGVLSFAALYELWPDPTKDDDDPLRWVWSTTIVTTDATGPAGEIHDRTPLILPSERIDAWLDPTLTDPARIQTLLTGIESVPLEVRPVSTEVNKVGNDRPDLIDPIDEHADRPLNLAMA
ncbi:MAG: DUF159 family protein [Pseudonocardiales bacterium]|nr:MAG: DUF159 family protein [Pseudonocardiales bacterium]